ncbi:MAG: ADP-forming succinate--CoA ligase subunit beta [Acidimicrobiales bacterium]
MDLFEYQGKQFLAAHGVAVVEGAVAATPAEVVAAAEALGFPVAVKAQVRVGGRGKAGGIRIAHDVAEAAAAGEAILGMDIKGHTVHQVWVEQAADVAAEYYVSITIDRAHRRYLAMLSSKGGMDIEEVAATEPEAIIRLPIDPNDGLGEAAARDAVEQAAFDHDVHDPGVSLLMALFGAFTSGDAELVEVNPLVVTTDRRLIALDAKVSLDDSARFRHPEWDGWATAQWHDERERRAKEKSLNYVGLGGTVGVIGNGAGLVLSTLDVVNQAGGSAANFLDVGGGARADVIAAALEVVNSDDRVRAVLVNIFGGITRGDEVARGIIDALGRVDMRSPIVVRLDGTNAEEGRALLAAYESDSLVSKPTMLDAAEAAVAMAGGGGS